MKLVTQVGDLGPLAGKTELRVVRFSNTPISSVEPLADIAGLQVIDSSSSLVTSLSPLHLPPGDLSCSVILAEGLDLDDTTVDVTIPSLCELGWAVSWSEPRGSSPNRCGPSCR